MIADEVRHRPKNIGYDANTGEYVDMYTQGIVDPAKVVKTALLNAASIAGLMLTTQVLVTRTDDVTENVSTTSKKWLVARSKRQTQLIELEGLAAFEELQRFLGIVHTLSDERRLSRFAFLSRKDRSI